MKPSKIDAVGFLVLVGVATFIYFTLIHGQGKRLKTVKADVVKLTRVTLENEGLENLLAHDRADLAPLREKISERTGRFVAANEIDGFLRRLMADAENGGIAVSLMRPGEPAKQQIYSYAPIAIQLEGAFSGVYSLLHRLETHDPLVMIERLQIRNEPGKEKCLVDLTFNLYLKPGSGT
ncbi:MAG TPA: type 4a pilus biogenesis protein PilO [Planctomycetota bacterium]|nr:type 4a pilus biogenesis protein PilO [Planctomycetota bacterium]